MYVLITGSRWKSHVALALFIYLYLNEDTESLIKVVIVANSAGRGSRMSDGGCVCRRGLCVQTSAQRGSGMRTQARTD